MNSFQVELVPYEEVIGTTKRFVENYDFTIMFVTFGTTYQKSWYEREVQNSDFSISKVMSYNYNSNQTWQKKDGKYCFFYSEYAHGNSGKYYKVTIEEKIIRKIKLLRLCLKIMKFCRINIRISFEKGETGEATAMKVLFATKSNFSYEVVYKNA